MLVSIVLTVDLHIAQNFFGVGAGHLQCGYPIDNVDGQAKTIDLVLDGQIERRVDVSSFLVPAHVQVFVIGASVGQAVDQPGIAVEVENDRFVFREQAVEVPVREAVGVFCRGDKSVEVHHVHESNLESGEVLTK